MRFAIHFESPDRHSPMNGRHQPVTSGAAFIAEYGDGLAVDSGDGCTGDDLQASDIDGLGIGCSLTVLGAWGESITVTREA